MLQLLQVITLLGALLFLASAVMLSIADFDLLGLDEGTDLVGWAIGSGVLAIAFSPALWSLNRGGAPSNAATPASGSYDRVPEQQPMTPQQPPRPGSAFEPMGTERAPAPPASSYGQPSGPGFGAQPSSGGMSPTSPPQGDSPWGSR